MPPYHGRMIEIPIRRLRALFAYDPVSGLLTRRVGVGKVRAGASVGAIQKTNGTYVRLVVCVDRKVVKVHRLIWAIVRGAWSKKEIDHINGNPLDNRISNLREAD